MTLIVANAITVTISSVELFASSFCIREKENEKALKSLEEEKLQVLKKKDYSDGCVGLLRKIFPQPEIQKLAKK